MSSEIRALKEKVAILERKLKDQNSITVSVFYGLTT